MVNISIAELSPLQAQAHAFLIAQPDMIDCPRGIRMRLAACKAMQASRCHRLMDGNHSLIASELEEATTKRADFLGCQGCEHYDVSLSRSKSTKDGVTDRKMAQDAIIRSLMPTRIVKPRRSKPTEAERMASRREVIRKQTEVRKVARQQQRDLSITQKKRTVKSMLRKGHSHYAIARAVKSRNQTVLGWIREIEANV